MRLFDMLSRIVEAEIFKLAYRLQGYKLSYGTVTEVNPVLLKLTDQDGHVGWGEANAQQPFTDESPDDVFAVLRDELLPIVLDSSSSEAIVIDGQLDQFRPTDHFMAKGAISMALLDLEGRRSGVRVADLLGGAIRTSLQVSHPLNNGSFKDDVALIDSKLEEGYVDYMLKMGTSPIPDEIERVAALKKRYGDRVRFKADPNAGWTLEQSLEFLEGVQDSQLAFVEQPISKNDIDGMAEITRSTKLPISVDESLTGMARAQEIIQKRAATVFSIKSSKNGGPLRAKALSELARENGIDCYFNSMIEGGITQAASLHHAVTAPNILNIGHGFRSTLRIEGDVTDFSTYIRNAVVQLPDRPGLGVQVDEGSVRAKNLASHLVRRL
ncbi:mandelate racemase [Mesorhizobium sp. M5C.F.Ca.IN.020.14.1.1]|nr:mandelate racemase [Mesorhizobium sp. M5C.F.Ca.IN.020.14.1.1]